MDRIKESENFLINQLKNSPYFAEGHKKELEYRIEHSYRVANIGIKIAKAEGFDIEKTAVACILHDVGYATVFKDESDYINHGRYGEEIARPFLGGLGYSAADVNEICYGIAVHVDDKADFDGKRTPLVLTVQDADNIDRFDVYRLYENLHIMNFSNLGIDEQMKIVKTANERLPKYRELEFGTDTAVKLWKEKIDFMMEYYKKLLAQLENSTEINY